MFEPGTIEEIDENLFPLPEDEEKFDLWLEYSETLKRNQVPIVIDNGSYQCKAGWSCNDLPSFVFRNHIARLRGKKENEAQVGNNIQNIEAVRWLLKTQFDRNVVTQFDVQEIILDYIFSHMGIDTEGSVNHPIVLTEALCNPNYSRQLMNELLFECYQVPSVAYGVDGLFSFHYNRGQENGKNGLILSLGNNTTHVIPVISWQLDVPKCVRINVGGQHMAGYLHRLLQLKYPLHTTSITLSRAENMLHKHVRFSKCYNDELDMWEYDDYYKQEVHKVQLPFTPLSSSATDTLSGKLEKCATILAQAQAVKIKRRTEKLAYDEERLQELLSVQELIDDDDDEAILALQELGYSTASELQAGIKELNCKIKKMKSVVHNQQPEELQDSPLKDWCEELELYNFPDVDSWIEAVRRKKEELVENPVQASFGLQSNELSGFGFSRALDMIGGLHEICGTDQSYNDYISRKEERREHIEILTEIITEYEREFSSPEQCFSYNMAEFYQLHLGVERIRVPEIILQPTLLGIEQAGLSEVIETVLSKYSPQVQQLLVENVFITGGVASIPFIKDRIEAELLSMRPFQSKFSVYLADNPCLDAWKGARLWCLTDDNLSKHAISRAEYEEKGPDYLKQHRLSNIYFPSLQVNRKGLIPVDTSTSKKTETQTNN